MLLLGLRFRGMTTALAQNAAKLMLRPPRHHQNAIHGCGNIDWQENSRLRWSSLP